MSPTRSGCPTSHQSRGLWRRSLSVSLVQVTGVCTLDLKVPLGAVTHMCITGIYCFQYELFKKCQETSCVCTLTETPSVCAAKSSTEGKLLPPLLCFLTVIYHRWLVFPPHSTWSTHKVRPIWGRNGLCNASGTVRVAGLRQKLGSRQESGRRVL